MGLGCSIYGLDDVTRDRLLALSLEDYEGDDEPDEEILEQLAESHGVWFAKRSDSVSWDLIHWALTESLSGVTHAVPGVNENLFGFEPVDIFGLEWAAIAGADQTRDLARKLTQVKEHEMRERLDRVPPEVYRSGPVSGDVDNLVDHMVADAHNLVALVERSAEKGIGLLIEMS
jgi:hypothetical protein